MANDDTRRGFRKGNFTAGQGGIRCTAAKDLRP
jgi:hypothetical protein